MTEESVLSPALREMPRLDLHCHLDGSLTQSCIESLLGEKVDPSCLKARGDCPNLAEYLERFELPLRCLRTPEGLEAGAYDFMRSLSGDHIIYVEVRFAPLLSTHENLSCSAVIEAVLQGLNRGKEELGIEYGVIVCAMRHMPEEENLKMLKTAREYLGSGVCAADLAGNEAAFPMSGFTGLFSQVKTWGMPFTIHGGECHRAENILEAVDCGARRIGHGIAMKDHPDLIRLCRQKRIGIEMCPTSNMQTKAVRDVASYPMKKYLKEGLLVTVNTDNRTVSNTSIGKELGFIQRYCGITDEDVRLMMRNAVETAFAPEDAKERLWKRISV